MGKSSFDYFKVIDGRRLDVISKTMRKPGCFIASPRKLFLIDALGAMVTAALTVGVLARWTQWFGMPPPVLYKLAIAGSVFTIYSFGCFLLIRRNFPPFLKMIALANLGYCLTAVAFCFVYRAQITVLGWVYFIGESLMVAALAVVEMRIAAALNKCRSQPAGGV